MDEHVGIRKLKAVLDFIRSVAEVERNSHATSLENAEIDGQPFKAVHEQNGNLVALLQSAAQKEVGETVRLSVELLPSDFTAERLERIGLYERILTPSGIALLKLLRIYLHKGDIVRPFARIAL